MVAIVFGFTVEEVEVEEEEEEEAVFISVVNTIVFGITVEQCGRSFCVPND